MRATKPAPTTGFCRMGPYVPVRQGGQPHRAPAESLAAGGSDDVTLYTYDAENRLTDVIFENESNVKQQEIRYTYDYAGRLIRMATNATGSGVFTYTYTVYDGQNPYLQVSDSGGLADTLTTPGISQRYLYARAADQILATDNCAGSVLFGLADYEGSICDVVDSTGVVAGHRTYKSFGNVQEVNLSGQNVTGSGTLTGSFPFAFTGQAYSLSGAVLRQGPLVRFADRPIHHRRPGRPGHEPVRLLRQRPRGQRRSVGTGEFKHVGQ